jgi:large subunit ribosomal protein L3
MNQYPGVIGRKLGMTQVFANDGTVVPCTVVEAQPVVVMKRTPDRDGYSALVLGLGERKPKHTSKPIAGLFGKLGVSPRRTLRELRCTADYAAGVEAGAEVRLDQVFKEGQLVDVQSFSRGRGFSGVMRRHNYSGQKSTHGSHEYKRHGGSIGTNMTPGRTLHGIGMPGQHGNKRVSVLNQRVVKVLPDEHLIFIYGGTPGAKNALVMVRGAVKAQGGMPRPKRELPKKK